MSRTGIDTKTLDPPHHAIDGISREVAPAESREGEDPAAGRTLNFVKQVPMKRVSFYVPAPLYEDIQEFARERGDTVTGVIRWSLGIGKAVWDEIKSGHKIRSDAPNGEAQKVMVFSRY